MFVEVCLYPFVQRHVSRWVGRASFRSANLNNPDGQLVFMCIIFVRDGRETPFLLNEIDKCLSTFERFLFQAAAHPTRRCYLVSLLVRVFTFCAAFLRTVVCVEHLSFIFDSKTFWNLLMCDEFPYEFVGVSDGYDSLFFEIAEAYE